MLRIGQGYDLHRLVEGRELRLGGVTVPNPEGFGLAGHSDADVLLHAIIDAVLGSAALGDIGQWFPDTDERYRGCDSRDLLRTVLAAPALAGWRLLNLDCTVVAQAPKLAPFIGAMRSSLAGLFGVGVDCISVKAKTNEGVDAIGLRQAIAAYAVTLSEFEPAGTIAK